MDILDNIYLNKQNADTPKIQKLVNCILENLTNSFRPYDKTYRTSKGNLTFNGEHFILRNTNTNDKSKPQYLNYNEASLIVSSDLSYLASIGDNIQNMIEYIGIQNG